MTRDEAYQLLTKHLKNKNLIKHSLAAEAAMKALCHKLVDNPDEETIEKWGIAGLLHDVDYEIAQRENRLSEHGMLIFKIEKDVIPSEIAKAIKAHNFQNTKFEPVTPMEWAITCCDQLTGLIVAAALVHPDRKLAPLTTDFILKRMKEKSFARGADREMIKLCEEKLDIPLSEFISITLDAMKKINKALEL